MAIVLQMYFEFLNLIQFEKVLPGHIRCQAVCTVVQIPKQIKCTFWPQISLSGVKNWEQWGREMESGRRGRGPAYTELTKNSKT